MFVRVQHGQLQLPLLLLLLLLLLPMLLLLPLLRLLCLLCLLRLLLPLLPLPLPLPLLLLLPMLRLQLLRLLLPLFMERSLPFMLYCCCCCCCCGGGSGVGGVGPVLPQHTAHLLLQQGMLDHLPVALELRMSRHCQGYGQMVQSHALLLWRHQPVPSLMLL